MKKIIFRADGNSETGLGHLYRLFSLVEIVKETIEFVFLTKEDSVSKVIPNCYNKHTIPVTVSIEDEPSWLAENFTSDEYLIIADGYQFTSNYQRKIKSYGYNLIFIDDLTKEYMYADTVINHSPYVTEEHFNTEPYTRLSLGTDYAMLRPSFLKAASQKRAITKIDSVFICFGGADSYNLTKKATEALLKFSQIKQIHIVLGGAYKHSTIQDLLDKNEDVVNIHRNLSENELFDIMKVCNFAIAPASTILYELCCINMPILSGFYVDNQELIYKGFLNYNAIFPCGNISNFDSSDFKEKIALLLSKKDYNAQILSQNNLFDSKIKERHLNLIKELC